MNKIFVLSASLVAFGLLFAAAAQAEDTMMKEDAMRPCCNDAWEAGF